MSGRPTHEYRVRFKKASVYLDNLIVIKGTYKEAVQRARAFGERFHVDEIIIWRDGEKVARLEAKWRVRYHWVEGTQP